jgi:hypothetical protein
MTNTGSPVDSTQSVTRDYAALVRAILLHFDGWVAEGNVPLMRIRRFLPHEKGMTWDRLEDRPDLMGLFLRRHSELLQDKELRALLESLIAANVIKRPQIQDSDGKDIVAFERIAPQALVNFGYVIVGLFRRHGRTPSEAEIANTYHQLIDPLYEVIVPLVGCRAGATPFQIGSTFELSPLTPEEKEAIWIDEMGQPVGTFLTLLALNTTTHKLGAILPYSVQVDLIEVNRIVTTLRLLKPGLVGAPAAFVRLSRDTFGGTIYDLNDTRIRRFGPTFELQEAENLDFADLYDKMRSGDTQLSLALRRFNQAYGRELPEDRIIDLAIALESSVLSDATDELKYRLSVRGATLLAEEKPPTDTQTILAALYDARSKIVHEGLALTHKRLRKIIERVGSGEPQAFAQTCEDLVRAILRSLLTLLRKHRLLREVVKEIDARLLSKLSASLDAR